MFLLLCSVKAYFLFFGYCSNASINLHYLKSSVDILFVCRHWNLHRQCARPFLIHGCLSCLCLWLYDASSLCLLFKGLDISPVRYISPWPSLPSSLVVGCSWKKYSCIPVKFIFPWIHYRVYNLWPRVKESNRQYYNFCSTWSRLNLLVSLCWILMQVNSRVSSVAAFTGKSGGGREHSEICRQEEQSRGSTGHLWWLRFTSKLALN